MIPPEPVLAVALVAALLVFLLGTALQMRGSDLDWRLSRDPLQRARDDQAARRLNRAGEVLYLVALALWSYVMAVLVAVMWLRGFGG